MACNNMWYDKFRNEYSVTVCDKVKHLWVQLDGGHFTMNSHGMHGSKQRERKELRSVQQEFN